MKSHIVSESQFMRETEMRCRRTVAECFLLRPFWAGVGGPQKDGPPLKLEQTMCIRKLKLPLWNARGNAAHCQNDRGSNAKRPQLLAVTEHLAVQKDNIITGRSIWLFTAVLLPAHLSSRSFLTLHTRFSSIECILNEKLMTIVWVEAVSRAYALKFLKKYFFFNKIKKQVLKQAVSYAFLVVRLVQRNLVPTVSSQRVLLYWIILYHYLFMYVFELLCISIKKRCRIKTSLKE